jgi:YggT family protein
MQPLIVLLNEIIGLYAFLVIIYVVIQLLAYFRILNTDQPVVIKVQGFLAKLIEPVLSRIRRYIKPYDGIDFSPFILLVILRFLQYCLVYYF